MGTNRFLKGCRSLANRAVSMAGYRKVRTQQGLIFWPENDWGFDPWCDLARIHKNKNGAVTVLDVGANVGQSILNVMDFFPSAKILSFEPDPRVFTELREVTRRFKDCTAFPFALGAEETHLQLRCSEASVGNSFLAVDADIPDEIRSTWNSGLGAVRVPVRRLDTVCKDLALSTVDILKIDVQGYELSVLEGAGSMLTPVGIRSVLLEIGLVPIYEHQATADQLFSLFATRGYSLVSLYPAWRLADGRMGWCDALFSVAP